jgi:putative ABC transport system permease protein
MGFSGSGKSTMMNIIGCLDRLTSGRYVFQGKDISGLNDNALSDIRLRHIGFIFQSFNLIPQLSVQRNIELPLYYLGWDTARSAGHALDLLGGRTLSLEDLEKKAPVVVLTEFGARKLLATMNTIGQTIRISGNSFEVVGIVRNETGQAGTMQIPDKEIDAYIPITTAQSYFGDVTMKRSSGSRLREKVELHQIIVQVDNLSSVEPTAKAIERMLTLFHKKTDYQLSVPLALLKQAEATKRTFNIVLGSIAGISLLVGGIGIMNIMPASVTERIREIGIRRAIGARRRQIIIQFLIEAVVLSTIGGIIGLVLGLVIPWLITWFAKMPTVITPAGIFLPLIVSIGIGIIFGLYPAARAARVDPIVALRHE